MYKQKQGVCPNHELTLAQKPGVNHILHLIITMFTFGGWILVWGILVLVNMGQDYRCTQCGNAVSV